MAKHKCSVLRKHCGTVGRDYDEIRKRVGFVVTFGDKSEITDQLKQATSITGLSLEETRRINEGYGKVWLKGSVSEICEELSRYKGLGLGWYVFMFMNTPSEDELELVKNEVIPIINP